MEKAKEEERKSEKEKQKILTKRNDVNEVENYDTIIKSNGDR